MRIFNFSIFFVAVFSIPKIFGQNDLNGIGAPGDISTDIQSPGGQLGSPQSPAGFGRPAGCCGGLPVIIPPPDIPEPICPGGVAPLAGPDGGVQFCLPTSEDCPSNSACWYNGINYYCCPMEGGIGYGSVIPTTYGGRSRPNKPPGSLPQGINPPSGAGGLSAPGGVPQDVKLPSSVSGNAPGALPQNVRPPAGPGPKRPQGRSGLQPPSLGGGTFPNPFTCCDGGRFEAPSHLPRNVNAPSERAIGVIQFFPGSNQWPPKENPKAKFGGPIRPDILWIPGHHPHFTNELTCCGPGTANQYGQSSPPSPYGPSGSSILGPIAPA